MCLERGGRVKQGLQRPSDGGASYHFLLLRMHEKRPSLILPSERLAIFKRKSSLSHGLFMVAQAVPASCQLLLLLSLSVYACTHLSRDFTRCLTQDTK